MSLWTRAPPMTPVCAHQIVRSGVASEQTFVPSTQTHIITEEQSSGSGGDDEPPDERGGALFALGADDRLVDLEAGLGDVLERSLVMRLDDVEFTARVGADRRRLGLREGLNGERGHDVGKGGL